MGWGCLGKCYGALRGVEGVWVNVTWGGDV